MCAVLAADVRLPSSGQQADVHHALHADPGQRHQRHAAFLQPGSYRTHGPANHQVRTHVQLSLLALWQSKRTTLVIFYTKVFGGVFQSKCQITISLFLI